MLVHLACPFRNTAECTTLRFGFNATPPTQLYVFDYKIVLPSPNFRGGQGTHYAMSKCLNF